jgi:hypothetical protein
MSEKDVPGSPLIMADVKDYLRKLADAREII